MTRVSNAVFIILQYITFFFLLSLDHMYKFAELYDMWSSWNDF